jgi:hypothetical protein
MRAVPFIELGRAFRGLNETDNPLNGAAGGEVPV